MELQNLHRSQQGHERINIQQYYSSKLNNPKESSENAFENHLSETYIDPDDNIQVLLLEENLNKWIEFTKYCVYIYLFIIITYSIYWTFTESQTFTDGHKHKPNNYILLCRVLLFISMLATAYICHLSANNKSIKYAKYSIIYLITITGIIISFIVYTTRRRIKIHKRHHYSKQKTVTVTNTYNSKDLIFLQLNGLEDEDEFEAYNDLSSYRFSYSSVFRKKLCYFLINL